MLRITTQTESATVTLQLEGELIGVWVKELFDAWRAAVSLDRPHLRVDLTSVRRVDKAGEYLLALLRCTGAQLAGSGLFAAELIRIIVRDWPLAAENAGAHYINKEA
jgi:ABC-type transporter Mla MlaB component